MKCVLYTDNYIFMHEANMATCDISKNKHLAIIGDFTLDECNPSYKYIQI